MESSTDHDMILSVDMDELGIRPWNYIDLNKPTNDYFGKEITADLTVYSAEIQLTNPKLRLTTNDDETLMSDEESSGEYDIDPETGEKIFREVAFTSTISFSSTNDKWIEEYLTNIETSSNQSLPTTTNQSEFNFEELSFASLDNSSESDWFENLIESNENSEQMMFTDPILSNEVFNINENQLQTTNHSTLNVLIDDEYSTTSSSSNSNSIQQATFENDSDIQLVEAKLEKLERHENSIMIRRSSARSINQGQQDEEILHQYEIPLTLEDITQSTTEEYNRHLITLSHLTAEQLHVIKDIRRRGKNKIAAQNCRKRKAISVESLLEEVDELKRVKHELEERKRVYQQQITETRQEYEYLHREVLPNRQLPPAIIVK